VRASRRGARVATAFAQIEQRRLPSSAIRQPMVASRVHAAALACWPQVPQVHSIVPGLASSGAIGSNTARTLTDWTSTVNA